MRKILSYIAVILWMALIFKLSAQTVQQSGNLSAGVSNVNIKVIEKVQPNKKFNIKEFNHKIRKNAHFYVFLVLGILVINALRRSSVVKYKFISLLICILYAISDELHQAFVPGRSPEVKDVLIDSAGALVGILIFLVINKISSAKYFKFIKE